MQVQNGRRVAQRAGEVVRDHNDGRPGLVQLADDAVHLRRGGRVQPRHRLVEQQQPVAGAERAGEQHALPLAAGERRAGLLFQPLDPQPAQALQRRFLIRTCIKGAKTQLSRAAGKRHLPDRGREIRAVGGLLRQIADAPAAKRLVKHNPAGKRGLEAEQRLGQRALAAPVLAHDAEIIAPLDGKGQIPQHHPALVSQRDAGAFNLRHAHTPPPACGDSAASARDRSRRGRTPPL